MPRARYSQRRADEMLTRGRVFYLTDTPAAVIVVGRENGTVVYNFLDDPADNRRSVRELRPRIKQIEDMHPDYLKRLGQGYKMRDGNWVAPETKKKDEKPVAPQYSRRLTGRMPEERIWIGPKEGNIDGSKIIGPGSTNQFKRGRRC